ncbi:hypothetical protein BT96DRAFT_237712 [Gymnopus androsaceus JB14]|uniref:Uncharacterized protein n=1 Tax=Gymnopus androsaceus JB14 TaxID=1447944 RepID=A0A6A4IQK7_9AGAR|nr:hypothetical protein BT96DRAFT_237712 [Gymnopus androsaceus JB14]
MSKAAKHITPKKYDKKRLEKCWALSDSNSGIGEPCIAFQTHAHRVIQASSPKPRRWKEWLKQKEGTRIVSDLPEVLEIAAVLKELKHDTSRTLSLVGQWGPSIRTIAKIISEPTFIEQLEIDAERVAMAIYASPPTFFSTLNTGEIPTSEGSPVLFLRPRRGNAPGANNVVSSSQSQFFILTKFLTDLFDNHRSKLENKTSLELFCAFASHSFTRTAAGWLHEQNMHSRMCASGLALDIFADSKSMQMQPSSLLLSGTTASFNHRGVTRSFYWIPSAINFPGIDAVLRDRKNLFALQASIANDHKTPLEGIQKVWKEASSTIQKNCTWHFVIIAENISTAKSLRAKFLKELDGLMLGNARVPVQVWYCVL